MRLIPAPTARAAARLLVSLLFASPALCAATPPASLLYKRAPEFAQDDIRGHRVDLASFRGRVVLLTFWATWCAPCQVEIPHFIRWQSELGPRGLSIVAVSMDDDEAPVLALMRTHPFNYPVLMGNEQIGHIYGGVLGLPITFLIDRQGRIAAIFKGESNLNIMKSRLGKLLAAH